jgi:hypothetical protein
MMHSQQSISSITLFLQKRQSSQRRLSSFHNSNFYNNGNNCCYTAIPKRQGPQQQILDWCYRRVLRSSNLILMSIVMMIGVCCCSTMAFTVTPITTKKHRFNSQYKEHSFESTWNDRIRTSYRSTFNMIPKTRSTNSLPLQMVPQTLSTVMNSTLSSNHSVISTASTHHHNVYNGDDVDVSSTIKENICNNSNNTTTPIHRHATGSDNVVQTMSSDEFHQELNKYVDRLTGPSRYSGNSNGIHHLSDMSSIDTIRTAMVIETLWKQRYMSHTSINSDNNNSNNTTSNTTDILSSFHIVLKSWSKACQILLELHDLNNHVPSKVTTKIDVTSPLSSNLPEVHVDMSNLQIYTSKDAAIHVTKLFTEQIQSHHMNPDRNTFHYIMDTWSKSRDMDAPKQVVQLMQLMQQKYSIQPDTLSYNIYIDTVAYGTIRNSGISSCTDRIEQINEIYKEMELCPTATPNTRTINSILHAYSTVIGKYVTQLNYNQVDERTKTSIENEIDTLLQNVLQIFNTMKEKYVQTKNSYDQPDITTYSTVMECFARHGAIQSTEQVETLLNEMKQIDVNSNTKRIVQPNVYIYSIAIKAWSRTYHPKAPHRAEELLKECIALCQQQQSSGDTSHTYQYNQNKLTSNIYTSVIQCWSRSQEPTKAVRVLQLLQDMRSMAEHIPTVTPTLLTYNTAIDTCAKTRGTPSQQTAALKIAFAIYKTIEITNSVQPNHITYATLLKAISTLVPQGDVTRNTLSKVVFEKAIQSSQVDRNVIQQLQKSCDTHILHSLLLIPSSSSSSTAVISDPNHGMIQTNKNGHIDYDKIPSEWSKNVRI